MRTHRLGIIAALLACIVLAVASKSARAQEVNGIYTDSTTKDLGAILKSDALKGLKIRGWVEGYYVYNFNRVKPSLANAHQADSAIKSRDLTIDGRTFDVHHNSFAWDL